MENRPAWPEVVFFDAGFTLLEPTEPVRAVYLREASALGVSLDAELFAKVFAAYWPRAIKDFRSAEPELRSSEELERAAWHRFTFGLAQEFPGLPDVHEEWLARLFSHFDSPSAWTPSPGARELLAGLKERGFGVGVISNWHSSLLAILAGHQLDLYCDTVVTSAAAGRKKPHPEIFERALAAMGVPAGSCLHVGDSLEEDIEGATLVGMRGILYTGSRKRGLNASETPPVPWICDLGDLWEHLPQKFGKL